MRTQPSSYRNRSLFIRRAVYSPSRLALISLIVFGLAFALGYTATAKAPNMVKSMLPGSLVQSPLIEPIPIHPIVPLLHLTAAAQPVVYTDKPNYFPGETALITGSRFSPGEVVTLQVRHADDTAEGGAGHQPWSVVADSFGNFTTSWFVDPDDSAGSTFLLTATGNSSGLMAQTTFTDGSANLDGCANGDFGSPLQCTGENWENGNLNAGKSHYFEGDSVPYRTVFENLVAGNTYTITIEYDTTQGGDHAFDYLTSFDRTEPTPGNNPCTRKEGGSVVTICNPNVSVTTPIPVDPNVTAGEDGNPLTTGDNITQIPGVFTLFNGNALSVLNPGSAYTLSGTYAGNSSTSLKVQFTATSDIAVLAWGAHISTRLDWGAANSALAINGSPYHIRLTQIACSGAGEQCNVGNQDHQLSAGAVFFPVSLTIIKETNPDDAQVKQFNYTTTGNNLGPFSLTPPNGTTPAQTQFSLLDTTQRMVTETDPHAAAPQFTLTGLSCSQTDGGLGVGSLSTDTGTRTVTFTPKEGQSLSCTFTNTEDFEVTRGKIKIVKQTLPDGSTQSFTFTANYNSNGFSLTDGQSNTSGSLVTSANGGGPYTVSEGAVAGWTSDGGVCDHNSTPSNIAVVAGQTTTCTFTNTQTPKLTVIKHVINNNGGTKTASDFTVNVTATNPSSSSFAGAESPGTTITLDAGSYSVDEGAHVGYTKTLSADCSGTIAPGDNKTCTITNDDQPAKLIVIKHVINDNGGTATAANFTLDSGGANDSPDNFAGAESPGTEVTLDAGSYDVTETGPSGYTASFSADCSGTIANGQTKTCTVTNDDQAAKLIVIKHVINNSGGTATAGDFTLDSGGTNDSPDNFAGVESPGTEVTLDAGSYNVTETGPSGYTASFSAYCSGTIANGQTKTCTVTNDDQPAKLIVIKHVINDNGGSATAANFTLDSGGTNDTPDDFAGAESPGTEVTLNAGSYNVTETGPSGYTASFSADCSGTIANGQTKTCTVTNDDKAAKLIVIKHVINNNGGTATAANFTLDSGGTNDSPDNFAGAESPGTEVTLDAGSYNVTETGPSGYTASFSAYCSGTIANGQTKTCTVTNDDQAAKLIVIKHVINDNGGTATAANFTLDSGGANDTPDDFPGAESPGTQVTLDAGSYNVTETGPAGYAASFSAYCSGTIANGQTKTCTVTNNDISPTLRVLKDVVPDTDTSSRFNLQIDGATAGTGANVGDGGSTGFVPVNAGNHTVGETAGTATTLSDYTTVIGGDCAANGTVSLALAQNKTCTITNTKKGLANIVKTVNGQPPASNQSFTFELRQGASTVSNGTVLESKNTDASGNINFTTKLVAGSTYQVCEWVFPGWNTNLTGDGPLFVPNSMIPPALPNPNVINLTVCADFTVQPGQTRTFNVNNSPPPGGRALTIGFWKNWSSCTGGGQKFMLDLALGIASKTTTNPPGGLVVSAQNPGSLWPNYAALWYLVLKGNPASTADSIKPAADCSKAFQLLDKSTIDGKKKMASDPLFNMTAQLVGAQLNRFMGAGINGSAIMDIDRAVLLNGKYKFDGLTYTPKLTTADANTANCLGTQLDNYNNGRVVSLCP